ncbi:MAG: sodium:solute symporter family protein [Candidatus Acidiferrales bacterium]
MSPGIVALTIISIIVVVGSLVGFSARFRRQMDLEQWACAGRGFGLVFVWLLMAGEMFTAYTFLGASGWAYSRGAPVLYVIGYWPLGCVVGFFITPLIWDAGRKHRLQTQADFFQVRYGSKFLAAFVALVGASSLIPYLQLQLTGLGLIVEEASYGAIHRTPAMIIGFALVAAFVFVSGIRGVAWVSIVKDLLLICTAVFIGFAVPHIYFGGIGGLFKALAKAKPGHLVMPGNTPNLGHAWYISTVFVTALAFYMWPHFFAATFTARDAKILRRNFVLMPIYAMALPLMLFVGLTAVLVLPGLRDGDLSVLLMVRRTFPSWFLGIIGGAGALTAMVAAAIQLLCGAALYAKNLIRPLLAPDMTEQQVATLAKFIVLALTAGAVLLAIYSNVSLVSLFILGTNGVAQLFPGVFLGIFSRRPSTVGVFTGLVIGIAIMAALTVTNHDPFHGLNAGFLALCVNFAATLAVSSLTRVHIAGFDEIPATLAAPTSASEGSLTSSTY